MLLLLLLLHLPPSLVASSLYERFKFDLRLADLSRSPAARRGWGEASGWQRERKISLGIPARGNYRLTVLLCFCTGLSCKLVKLSRCLPAAAEALPAPPPPAAAAAPSLHSVELRGRICRVQHSVAFFAGGLNIPVPVKWSSLRFCFMGKCCAVATSGERGAGTRLLPQLLLGSELNPLVLPAFLGDSSVLLRRRCPVLGEWKRGRCCCCCCCSSSFLRSEQGRGKCNVGYI